MERETRAWKLFLLALRMLLTRPPRGVQSQIGRTLRRIRAWRVAESGVAATSRRRRRDTGDDLIKRAKKALQLVQWGELSTARQALEGAAVAQSNERTLAQLTDPARRPELPRAPIPTRIQSPRTGGIVWRTVVEEPPFFTPRCSGRTFGQDWRTSSCDSGLRKRQRSVHSVRTHSRRRGSSSRDCEGHSDGTHDRVEETRRKGPGIVVGDFLRRLPAHWPSNSPRRFWKPQPHSSLPSRRKQELRP